MKHASIQGSWTHSFEEDQGDIQVYRPTHSYTFPPARKGRETLQFEQDGLLTIQTPGLDDRPRATVGRWMALGTNRFQLSGIANSSDRTLEIVEYTPQTLRVRRH